MHIRMRQVHHVYFMFYSPNQRSLPNDMVDHGLDFVLDHECVEPLSFLTASDRLNESSVFT
jgi:hypothetical protein